KKSFYGCSNYPECKFTLADNFRKKKLTKTNLNCQIKLDKSSILT
ncbi:topoisomerase DNA-binding C4 zinc finger domain-containing protein, partial [Enterococcus faecium]|nr:topoisomerase DNA-binding C4 zinc finger domain-containing protein [Enterococcus faecium]